MNERLDSMSVPELEKMLCDLNDSLEDVLAMRKAVLGQTGHHVPGSSVKKFEQEVKEIGDEIDKVKELLRTKLAAG